MPLPTNRLGIPGTRIIPAGWSEHHAHHMPTAYNARVTITDPNRATAGTFTNGVRTPASPWYIAGWPEDANPAWREGLPCRIQRLKRDNVTTQAEQQIYTRHYLLQFPTGSPNIETGYTAEVITCPNDINLVGEVLAATDEQHGSEAFNRDIVFVHNQQPTNTHRG